MVHKLFQSSHESVDDEQLIRSFINHGEHAGFEALVRRHCDGMRRVLFAVLNGNVEDMEEAEQEILLSLFRTLPAFTFRSSFKTWLYRFCRNKAIDLVRKRQRDSRLQLELKKRAVEIPSGAASQNPESQVLLNEKRDRIREILASLSEKERSILVLKDAEGLSINEISDITGLPEGTVKSRLYRCRERAARLMEELK
jgi:RNA polymerase sigma-70 factor, ECF subfamily